MTQEMKVIISPPRWRKHPTEEEEFTYHIIGKNNQDLMTVSLIEMGDGTVCDIDLSLLGPTYQFLKGGQMVYSFPWFMAPTTRPGIWKFKAIADGKEGVGILPVMDFTYNEIFTQEYYIQVPLEGHGWCVNHHNPATLEQRYCQKVFANCVTAWERVYWKTCKGVPHDRITNYHFSGPGGAVPDGHDTHLGGLCGDWSYPIKEYHEEWTGRPYWDSFVGDTPYNWSHLYDWYRFTLWQLELVGIDSNFEFIVLDLYRADLVVLWGKYVDVGIITENQKNLLQLCTIGMASSHGDHTHVRR